jgi:hypothetical protein
MLNQFLHRIVVKRAIMFVLVMLIAQFVFYAPSWASFLLSLIFCYLVFPESRGYHIASSKIVAYYMSYNQPRHGNPGDIWHKIDEDALYKMDASGEWKRVP